MFLKREKKKKKSKEEEIATKWPSAVSVIANFRQWCIVNIVSEDSVAIFPSKT